MSSVAIFLDSLSVLRCDFGGVEDARSVHGGDALHHFFVLFYYYASCLCFFGLSFFLCIYFDLLFFYLPCFLLTLPLYLVSLLVHAFWLSFLCIYFDLHPLLLVSFSRSFYIVFRFLLMLFRYDHRLPSVLDPEFIAFTGSLHQHISGIPIRVVAYDFHPTTNAHSKECKYTNPTNVIYHHISAKQSSCPVTQTSPPQSPHHFPILLASNIPSTPSLNPSQSATNPHVLSQLYSIPSLAAFGLVVPHPSLSSTQSYPLENASSSEPETH